MSQSDYNIENADGATVRADINSQLEAIGSTNSGSTAPSVTFPYMRWHDTASSQLKERNGANTAWIVVADIVSGELVPHAGGAQVPQISGGADANFTAAPQVGGEDVLVENTSGVVIQNAFTSTGSVISTTTVLPYDDTIPQDTEGGEALSLNFTPKRADSRILVRTVLNARSDTNGRILSGALFTSGSSDAIAAGCSLGDLSASSSNNLAIVADIASPGTSEITISARFGPNAAATTYLNSTEGGSRRFGGVSATTMEIMEYMP